MDINTITRRIKVIWEDRFSVHENWARAPLLYSSEIKENAFVFVGCNPSFIPSRIREIVNGNHNAINFANDTAVIDFYNWNRANADFEQFIQDNGKIERLMRANYSTYFNEFDKIIEQLGVPSQGLDVFLYREKTQNNFKDLIFQDNHNDFDNMSEFANSQIELFLNILKDSRPRLILFANAFISDLIKYRLGNQLIRGKHEDFHRFNGIPVFFSSMLSNAKLDRHSKQRLIWQMQRAIKNKHIKKLIYSMLPKEIP